MAGTRFELGFGGATTVVREKEDGDSKTKEESQGECTLDPTE